MEHYFNIDVFYDDKIIQFSAALQDFTLHYRIVIYVWEHIVYFEPDEERNFRAVVENPLSRAKIPSDLLQLIAIELLKIFHPCG